MTKFTCVSEYDTNFRLVSFSLMHANGIKIVLPVMLHLRQYLISVLVTVCPRASFCVALSQIVQVFYVCA